MDEDVLVQFDSLCVTTDSTLIHRQRAVAARFWPHSDLTAGVLH